MDHLSEPLSPMAQCLDSSCFCLCILGVLEFEVPVPRLHLMSFLKSLLSIPRFSSILVRDNSGVRIWERVEVMLEDHVIEPTISWDSMSKDKCFSDYLSNIATPYLHHSKPLLKVHVIQHSTNNNTTLVFNVHRSIGDGYTLMSILLACLKRADDPPLPVTFPSLKSSNKTTLSDDHQSASLPSFVSAIFTSIKDFGWSFLKSTLHEDDKTPIRSALEGVEFQTATLSSITFPFSHIRDIKSKLEWYIIMF